MSVWPLLVKNCSSLSAAAGAISIFSIMTWEGIPPNGVDLVRQIYHTDPGGKIVFVTGHGEKGMDILRSGVRPFGFIEKCVDQNEMVREYIRYLKMAAPEQQNSAVGDAIELPIGIDETVRLPVSEILYVDSVKTVAHSICCHLTGQGVTARETIEHAQEQLEDQVIRCRCSVLVRDIAAAGQFSVCDKIIFKTQ